MKPLNRPMFRYGGPIKEGIMNGMKDNTGTGLVGDKRYPKTDGRSHHFAVAPFIPAAVQAVRIGAQRAIPKIANFFRTQVGTKTVPRPGPTFIDKGKFVPAKNVRIPSSGTYSGVKFQPGKNIGTGTMEVPVYQPNFLGRDPVVRAIGGIYKGVTSPQAKGVGSKVAQYVFSPTGLITGAVYVGGKFFNSDGTEIENPEEKGLTPGGEITTGTTKPGESGGTTVNQDKLEQMNKDKIQATKDRYYKIFGLDNMKKEAVYDSLIDASKIISEEGADLKGAVKSGTLQNRIIQAISGQLDKSAALKRQIDAAVLKGEIEKDIKANDPSAKLAAEYTKKRIELTDKQLAGGDLEDIAAQYRKQNMSLKGQNLFTEASRKGIQTQGILPTEAVDDFKQENPTLTEADFVNIYQDQLVESGKDKLPAGDYVVGARIITIGADGKAKAFVF